MNPVASINRAAGIYMPSLARFFAVQLFPDRMGEHISSFGQPSRRQWNLADLQISTLLGCQAT
jgi:hypothetical protein